jgi:hypothetical protein
MKILYNRTLPHMAICLKTASVGVIKAIRFSLAEKTFADPLVAGAPL